MTKEGLNTDVTESDLKEVFSLIERLNVMLNEVGIEIFQIETSQSVLSKPSSFAFSVIHRAIELNRGFLSLSGDNNWITSVNLLRLQADNCMRLYAMSLTSDKLGFCNKVKSGAPICNIDADDGKKMTDNYLSKRLGTLYPGFRALYENTSGFIHFSNEHMNFNLDAEEVGKDFRRYIRLSEQAEITLPQKVDYAFNLYNVSYELYRLLHGHKASIIKQIKSFAD